MKILVTGEKGFIGQRLVKRLQKDMEKVLSDIEKLKDKQRTFANGNYK